MLAIEGAIITIDAMGCQRDIAQKVIDKKADYVLALKGNQGSLREDVELFVTEQKASGFVDTEISGTPRLMATTAASRPEPRPSSTTSSGSRNATVGRASKAWSSSRAAAKSAEKSSGKHATISLRWSMTAASPRAVIRSHWAIENSLHWVMDMMFRDDECRVRTDHAPANFATIKHMAINLLRRPPGKQSLRGRRKAASWDDDFLASLIAT